MEKGELKNLRLRVGIESRYNTELSPLPPLLA
ncbi:hypothetical protein BX659_12738 [Orenia metallireducens]|uniref:Uncharacterized protein n=1 Tax=Orenia metallireducens TaxID=1413210 RepID=A0A285I3S9_9FIRM|nr:hypothetical protein BX659_12738 [Orenia metallireducens]SNY42618.1 hypothetical protein SAMN06265827_13038 [Orenia metallireducens]